MGPVITGGVAAGSSRSIDAGDEQGASVVVDGRGLVVAGHEGGFFVGPTVLDQVTPDMGAYVEEIFGPVLVVLRVDTSPRRST